MKYYNLKKIKHHLSNQYIVENTGKNVPFTFDTRSVRFNIKANNTTFEQLHASYLRYRFVRRRQFTARMASF